VIEWNRIRRAALVGVAGLSLAIASAAGAAAQGGEPFAPEGCWPQDAQIGDSGYPRWNTPPEMVIDEDATYLATIETNKGVMTFELNSEAAPTTVNNFICLATNDYYDIVLFHRVIDEFMVQSGDPTGTGAGDPGYRFDDELPGDDLEYTKGTLAMANAGPNTQGAQFFIVDAELGDGLPKDYTIFGQMVDGEDVLDAIAGTPVEPNERGEPSRPTEYLVIYDVTIEVESGS
jgi:peptidylprolyl isomerase